MLLLRQADTGCFVLMFHTLHHALRKPDPGEPSSLENLEQTEILPGKVYQTEIFPEQTEILTKQTEIMEDQDA